MYMGSRTTVLKIGRTTVLKIGQKKSSNWLHTPDYAIISYMYTNPSYEWKYMYNKHTLTLVTMNRHSLLSLF